MRGRDTDMEAFSGQEALTSWIRANALAEIHRCLRDGQGWQYLHDALAAYDLAIRPRGAGLVIATADGKLMVRASRFSRALSFQSLAKRWGAYAPASGERPPATMRYEREPKRKKPSSARLWAEYQDARKTAMAARAVATADLQEAEQRRWAIHNDWREERVRTVHNATDLTGLGRAHLWQKLSVDIARSKRELRDWREDEQAEIHRNHPLPTWFGFLQRKASDGDTDALAILRDKEAKRRVAGEAFAAAADEGAARDVVYATLRPFTRKNGQVVYDLRDGGQVIDRPEGLWVQVNTPHAIFLTLCLQRERSPGRAVKLGGDAAFQRQMIEMAAAKRMDLTFADLRLERQRCELMGLPVPPLPELPAPPPSLASTARKLLAQLSQALIGGGKARRT